MQALRQAFRPLLAGLVFLAGLLLLSRTAYGLPPAGTDTLMATAVVDVTTLLGQETIFMQGTVTLERAAPHMEAGVAVVDAEIVGIDLAGTSVTGPVTLRESPTRTSTGEIRSLQPPPDDFPASSSFDAFIEVTVPASPSPTITLHNTVALHIESEDPLSEWPPVGVRYESVPGPCVPLLPALPKAACVTRLIVVLTGDAVGGIAVLPDVAEPAPAARSSSPGDRGALIGFVAAAVAGVIALAAVAGYARRR